MLEPVKAEPSRPTFSVGIPCYNYGHFLTNCVNAVLEQRDVDVEVLIVDDCSSDDTAEVSARLAQDPRVDSTRHEANRGHIATFNECVDWASAEFFVLISADDLLAPGALRRAADAFDRHPSVGLVYGGVERFTGSVDPTDLGGPSRIDVHDGWDWIERRCRAADNSTHSPEIVLRTSVQHEIGHYDEQCRHTSDLNMWLRAAARSDVAYLAGTVQAYYRLHSANMSRVEHGQRLGQFEQRLVAFDRFFATEPDGPGLDRLRTMVGRRIAGDALREASRSIERGDISGDHEIEPYVQLARDTDPAVRRRPAYLGLAVRRRLGRRARFFPGFLASRVTGLVRRRMQWRDMTRRGL